MNSCSTSRLRLPMRRRPQTTTLYVTIARNAVLSTATFAAIRRMNFPILGWSRALISFRFSQTTRSDSTCQPFYASQPESQFLLSRSLFYTRYRMILGCSPEVATPSSRSKRFETILRTCSRAWTNLADRISRKPPRCGTRSPNQAMERTATRRENYKGEIRK